MIGRPIPWWCHLIVAGFIVAMLFVIASLKN